VYYYLDPVAHKYNAYQLPFVLFSWTTYMCLIIMTQSHTSTTLISAQSFFPNDNLHVYYHLDPVSREYYAYQRPVVFIFYDNLHLYNYRDPVAHNYYRYDHRFFSTTTYMCIFIVTQLHTCTKIISAQSFFPNDNLHVYHYDEPVSHEYYAYKRPLFFSK
jgi:hypothetical protein